MGISVGGNLVVGRIEPPARPVARGIRQIIAERLAAEAAAEAARKIEEQDALPIDANRPIYNSLIDRKENSRYMLDLVKV